jgi:hypothetical protein
VLKALAIAEGANPTASLHHAKIIRKSENGPTQVPVDIKEIFAGKAPDVTLQANNILFVPSVISNAAGKQHRQDFYDAPPPGPPRPYSGLSPVRDGHLNRLNAHLEDTKSGIWHQAGCSELSAIMGLRRTGPVAQMDRAAVS